MDKDLEPRSESLGKRALPKSKSAPDGWKSVRGLKADKPIANMHQVELIEIPTKRRKD